MDKEIHECSYNAYANTFANAFSKSFSNVIAILFTDSTSIEDASTFVEADISPFTRSDHKTEHHADALPDPLTNS